MKLAIVHSHLRPGGVRRIIELATPHLVRHFDGAVRAVVLAVGERADSRWSTAFQRQLGGTPVELFVEPGFKYLSEQNLSAARIKSRLRSALGKLLANANANNTLVWAHNPGVGRNLLLTRELTRACAARRIPLVMHHHDWWFDNRWLRWPEIRRSGFRTLRAAARTVFPQVSCVRHFGINHSDAARLQRHFSTHAGWLPNLTERGTPPSAARVREAHGWLRRQLNGSDAPVWILPCRLLRRKNIAEALLLMRWLRPEAWLVTTGGASSAQEQFYCDQLGAAAHRHHWPLRLGILQGDETGKPAVAELLAASEAVLLTSIQEGFGLPYLEAAAARRPLVARSLPNVAPDLRKFGFRFPQGYDDILIDQRLFDWPDERERQRKLFRAWRQRLPRSVQSLVGRPALLRADGEPHPVPFSRLTLTAQLEVLAQPVAHSWALCAPLNLFLPLWRTRAAAGRLCRSPWPRTADDWLSGRAYARRFAEIVARGPQRPLPPAAGLAVQKEFLREVLSAKHLFPLLWSTRT
jgi:glycosyltransferase involved in cell wall biosynthesis